MIPMNRHYRRKARKQLRRRYGRREADRMANAYGPTVKAAIGLCPACHDRAVTKRQAAVDRLVELEAAANRDGLAALGRAYRFQLERVAQSDPRQYVPPCRHAATVPGNGFA